MRADEERAFEEFVAGSANRLLLSAVLLVGGDRAAGEDLLQGAFERTYRHWSRVAEGQPEAYVRRALVNAATSRWRRLRARVTEVPLLTEHGHGGFGPQIADHAEALSARDGLTRALRTLPPRQRAIVVLRYLDDLPEAEVAALLGCSVGSVRSQASRGLARLRDNEHLAGIGGGGAARWPVRPAGQRSAAVDVLTNEGGGTAGVVLAKARSTPAGRHRAAAQPSGGPAGLAAPGEGEADATQQVRASQAGGKAL
ncbi:MULTISPECIES: SigE family RNA polymerase sigma factor [unclassified Pseudofrankia]|uniref:SigE family RNA polymerase sigma factor n=1 Tax=unclassified Pseudofrankia TaxID=2994372 RepID=UPI0009F6DA37|nr:SigE family RNA polymerase sigma factor [Pseudofrankia sp. BMG5.37]